MDKKSMAIAILLLKILTLLFIVASIVVLVLDSVDSLDFDQKLTFNSFYGYRYVLSVDAIGGAYVLVQILLWALSINMRTYFRSKLIMRFHQFVDLVFAIFFATGVGAGFGLSVDAKEEFDDKSINKYFNLIYVSSAFLLLATISMAAIILSSMYVLARK